MRYEELFRFLTEFFQLETKVVFPRAKLFNMYRSEKRFEAERSKRIFPLLYLI